MDRQTREALDRLVGREGPTGLTIIELSALSGRLHDAWVAGDIPGFPEDASVLEKAQHWALRVPPLRRKGSG